MTVTFPDILGPDVFGGFDEGVIGDTGFFRVVGTPGTREATDLLLGRNTIFWLPVEGVQQNFQELIIGPTGTNITTGAQMASALVDSVNAITTDAAGQLITNVQPLGDTGSTIQRLCTATASGNSITLTQITSGVTNIDTPVIGGGASVSFDVTPRRLDDHLKYDCRRVNVIIDKTGTQYYQDIDFMLTPQGNINWLNGDNSPMFNTIYTVHYESVIQYRSITAMHINRFAQVPDRSTGLVAQVKMPEQWMLQKEFLIRRRDQYGNEIKATGIYGDIIAAQPLNPAPADTLIP